MRKKLRKLTDDHLNEDEADAILRDAIQAKFDAELRLDLEKSLRDDYNLTRENAEVGPKQRKGRSRLFYLAAIAASLVFMILTWNVFNTSSGNARELASDYLATSEIYHSGALKGKTPSEETRMQAIRAFNAGEYAQAEQYFSSIEEKTEEDIFYSGISSLYNGKYEDAIAKLESLAKSESRYQEEANWYLAIAYILHGNQAAAKVLILEIEPSDWNYNESRKLLEAME